MAATSLGVGFFRGIVIGYALMKVAKLIAIVLVMFLSAEPKRKSLSLYLQT
jgi:uncharacterized membrane protein (Fun14 family)